MVWAIGAVAPAFCLSRHAPALDARSKRTRRSTPSPIGGAVRIRPCQSPQTRRRFAPRCSTCAPGRVDRSCSQAKTSARLKRYSRPSRRVPFELRLLLAAKPEALSAIGRIFVQVIQRWQREHARALGYEQPETAAVSFCQRFGSSLNLNIHWHVIVPDAVFLQMPAASGSTR
jgi:hypothetical protein